MEHRRDRSRRPGAGDARASGQRRLPYELSLTPLAIAVILVATAVPLGFGGASGWSIRFDLGDVIQNLLLYAPLGVALRRYPAWKVGVMAALLSLAIEVSQVWVVSRFASPFDVLSNASGAVLARWLARRMSRGDSPTPVMLRVTPMRMLLAVAVLGAVLAAWTRPTQPPTLANWDPAYPMLVGNERTSNRPWRGTVSNLQLFSAAARYELAEPIVADGGPGTRLPAEASTAFGIAAIASNAFTVVLSLSTDDPDQDGPARILSFSDDTTRRNFDIGQVDRQLVLRIRTPMNGLNGERHRVTTSPVLTAGREVRVVATYDGATASVYVDGILRGRGNLAAVGCDVIALCGWAAPPLWAILGAVLATLALAIFPVRSPPLVAGIIIGSCLAAVMLNRLLPITPLASGELGVFPWFSLVGAAVVGGARLAAVAQDQPAAELAPPRADT